MRFLRKTAAFVAAAVLISGFGGIYADELDISNPADRELLEQQAKEQEEALQKEKENVSKKTVERIETKKYITALNEVMNADDSAIQLVLNKLGALKIFAAAEDFSEDGLCSRGLFCDMLAKISNGGEELAKEGTEFNFKDVPEGHQYYDAISYMQNRHYVLGYEDGKFLPDDAISYKDALILVIKLLGYNPYAEYMGGPYDGYMNIAMRLGLSGDAKHNENGELTLGGAVMLVNKALETKTAKLDYITEESQVYEPTEDTLLYRDFKLTYVSGVVTGNSRTALESKKSFGDKNVIQIDGKVIDFDETDLNADSYLGLYCEALYDADTLKGRYISLCRNSNDILRLTADKIYGYNSAERTVLYETESGKTKEQKIPRNIDIIFNGTAVEGAINDEMFTPDIGELAFIDNDIDGVYDCLIIDSFSVYISAYTGAKVNDIISDKNGLQPNIITECAEQLEIYRNDSPASVTELVENDVLLVESDKYSFEKKGGYSYVKIDADNSSYYRIVAVNDVISEKVKKIDGLDVELEKFKTRISRQYEIARITGKNSLAISEIDSGVSGNFGLDAYGNIVYFNKMESGALKYGYLISAGAPKKGNFGDELKVKIFSEDSEMVQTKFASKVKLHNKWSGGELNTSTYFPKTVAAAALMNVPEFAAGGKAVPQLVKFGLNSNGEVRELYLSAMATKDYQRMVPPQSDENILECVANYSDGTYCNFVGGITMGFDFTFGFGVHTMVFQVPQITEGAADSSYKVLSYVPYGNNKRVDDAMLYDVESNGCIRAMVQKIKPVDALTGAAMTGVVIYKTLLITEVDKNFDPETREYNTSISGFLREHIGTSSHVTYTFSDQELQSQMNSKNTNEELFRPDTSTVAAADLQAGDFIEISLDTNGNINGFKVLWKDIADKKKEPQKGEWLWDTGKWTINSNGCGQLPFELQNAATFGGRVVYCRDGIAFVDTGRDDGRYRKITNGTYSPNVLYDMQTKKSSVITIDEVREGDYIYWNTKAQAIMCFGVIRR